MSDWSVGYVTELNYTKGYYRELNPAQMPLALYSAGLAAPRLLAACELGYGMGLSANIHAATSGIEWHGTDFNPSQAAQAMCMANASGAKAQWHDEAFADYCNRSDLPDFDFIGLHGIWSWISSENRAVLVDFVRRKLKVGGVLYVSYNTLPGWTNKLSLRHVLTEHAHSMSPPGESVAQKVNNSLAFFEKLLATQPQFLGAHPHLPEWVNAMKGYAREYLAHEYFNRDWLPMYFAEAAGMWQSAKLSYACSARLTQHVTGLNMSEAQHELLYSIPDPTFRETVMDHITNQSFRTDYWVKGPHALANSERDRRLGELEVVLTVPRESVPSELSGSFRRITIDPKASGQFLDLVDGHRPVLLSEIESKLNENGIGKVAFLQLLQCYHGLGVVQVAQPAAVRASAAAQVQKLNQYLVSEGFDPNGTYLASSVTGGGERATSTEQMFVEALYRGLTDPAAQMDHVERRLQTHGLNLLRNGTQLTDAQAVRHELVDMQKKFMGAIYPRWQALGVLR